MLKICTVYFEGLYKPEHVSKLYRSLKENSTVPFEFICLSDTDVEADVVLPYNHHSNIKKHWHKLKYFSPQFAYQNPGDDIIIMDIDTISLVQKKIKLEIEKLKSYAIYSVDTMEKLQYIRGQIRSLEDLQQSLKDLLSTTEYEDEVHGDTETD